MMKFKYFPLFLSTSLLMAQIQVSAQSFSLNGGVPRKTPEGEVINVAGKSNDSKSEACGYAKSGGSDYAKRVNAINFSFAECDCSSRMLDGLELSLAQTGKSLFRKEITEYICNVDVRIRLK